MSVLAIIPAGGSGIRFDGGNRPKQYQILAGKPVIINTLETICKVQAITGIAVAVTESYLDYMKLIMSEYEITEKVLLFTGGRSRQESVYNVIKSGVLGGYGKVVIHDSVRPLASPNLFTRVIEELNDNDAVITGIKLKDTIKEHSGNDLITLDRDKIYSIQTPQGFRADLISIAHFHAVETGYSGTDDASLVEKLIADTKADFKVKIIEGEERNIKITTKFDLGLAEYIMSNKN